MRNVELTLGSDHADPNRFAVSFWIFQPCLLGLSFVIEGPRERRELHAHVLEEEPSLYDSGHVTFYSTGWSVVCEPLRPARHRQLARSPFRTRYSPLSGQAEGGYDRMTGRSTQRY
jgi:hypothetical protein